MAEEQNTEIIPCPECKSLDTDNGEPLCLKGYKEFRKQLVSGQTTVCPVAERA